MALSHYDVFGSYSTPKKRVKQMAKRIRKLEDANAVAEVVGQAVAYFGDMSAMSDYWIQLVREARQTLDEDPHDTTARAFMQDSILTFFKLAEVNTLTKSQIIAMIEELED